jgi:hypothetical protein
MSATTTPVEDLVPNQFQRRILFGLNLTGKHIYAGTVPAAVIARRRARNKAARQARRAGRRAA